MSLTFTWHLLGHWHGCLESFSRRICLNRPIHGALLVQSNHTSEKQLQRFTFAARSHLSLANVRKVTRRVTLCPAKLRRGRVEAKHDLRPVLTRLRFLLNQCVVCLSGQRQYLHECFQDGQICSIYCLDIDYFVTGYWDTLDLGCRRESHLCAFVSTQDRCESRQLVTAGIVVEGRISAWCLLVYRFFCSPSRLVTFALARVVFALYRFPLPFSFNFTRCTLYVTTLGCQCRLTTTQWRQVPSP